VLLAGAGISGVKLRSRSFLVLALAVSLVVDSIGGIYNSVLTARMMENMRWYFKELAAASGIPAGAEMGMQIGMYVGLFFNLGWMVARTVFYVAGLIYFNRKNVKDAFEAAA
jgi:hypothetical protein